MRTLILAGGFGIRMGPLSDIPKALMVVNGKTLLEHMLEKLKEKPIIATNRKFERFFRGYGDIHVEDAERDEEKPGAVLAIDQVIKRLGIDDDLFVLCSDNYFSEGFEGFLKSYRGEPQVGVYFIEPGSQIKLEEMGTIELEGLPKEGESFRITGFKEKPARPLSNFVSTGAYILPRSTFPILEEYCREGKRDHLRGFVEHLLNRGLTVRGYLFGGEWFDIAHRSCFRAFSSANLVKRDERYLVCDLNLKGLVLSMTALHPGMQTSGHSHDVGEVYVFLEGQGEVEVGEDRWRVGSKDLVVVEPGKFHRVHNRSDKDLIFICVFEKYEGRGTSRDERGKTFLCDRSSSVDASASGDV